MAKANSVPGAQNQSIGRTWWIGVWPALLGIMAIELFSRFALRMTSPGPILMLAVVYSAFVGGLQSGLIAAWLLLIYHSYFFYYQTDGSTERIVRLATLFVVTPLMAILVGLSKRRAEISAAELSRLASEERFRGEQDRAQNALLEQKQMLETINGLTRALTAELDLDKLVQQVTDAATTISGAEFGAFFYNVIDSKGERYMLYTLSGRPRSDFDKFPMPRNTDIFAPTFSGDGNVRLDDVTKDPRYGKNNPHYGMPQGHLPVKSYLAVPVVSRSGEVLGGLFFGHSKPCVFTESAERIVSGIAATAAVGIDNARLFGAAQRDLADRQKAQAALVEAEERVRMAVQSANVGTWDWDLRADELVFSDRCKMIFGLPVDQPITYELFVKLLHPDDRARTIDVVESVLAPDSNGDYELEYRAIWPDGSIHWVSARGHAFFEGEGNARKPVRFTGTALDITDRKEAELQVRRAKEEAESANQAKDQFLAALSHELRTPLTPVLLTATTLENDPSISPKLREDLGLIRRNVELEARLIDDLLDLTRIARGKLQLDVRALDPATCLTAALEVCHDDLVSKGLKLKLSDPDATRFVLADPARLQQIFWNLIKNAVKFTPRGGEVRIICEDVGDRYRVTVNDTGMGIDPGILPRIFDAFEQGEDLITRQFGGLGMGLAISKALIDLHSGTLTAQSDGKDQGATFVMELPTVPAPIAEQPDASPQPSAAVLRSLRILLVEDHDATNRVLSLLLRQLKHEVTSTTTVAEALRHADHSRFDLLISDLGLPDGSGLDLMRELREKYHLTGICLSGYGMDHDIRRSKEAGFARHLTKPVDFRRLKATIESVVQ